MAARRYRYTWDSIASVDSDFMNQWAAFEPGRTETVDFDDDALPKLAFTMADDGNSFSVVYIWCAHGFKPGNSHVRARVMIARQPCRFGGHRVVFVCPCCERRARRLAVLPDGLSCGSCGNVTYKSSRERPVYRCIRRANKIADKLDSPSWDDITTTRPPGMHLRSFLRLQAEQKAAAQAVYDALAQRKIPASLVKRLRAATADLDCGVGRNEPD